VAESRIGYSSHEDGDDVTLLSIAPAGSEMDRVLKANLRSLATAHAGTPLADRIADVMQGKLTLGGLTRSTEFAPIMASVSQNLATELASLDDEQKERLRRGEPPAGTP
jgi:hypothetical protein